MLESLLSPCMLQRRHSAFSAPRPNITCHFPHLLLLLPHHCSCCIFFSLYLSQAPFPYTTLCSSLSPLPTSSSIILPLSQPCSNSTFLYLHHPFPILPVISPSLFSVFSPLTCMIFIAVFSIAMKWQFLHGNGCPSTHLTLSLIQPMHFSGFIPRLLLGQQSPRSGQWTGTRVPFPS